MNPVAGRVAIVTGASKGLGRAVAQALAEAGAKVALVARSQDLILDLAATIGGDAAAFPCDLRSSEEIRATVRSIGTHFGRIDILINNAVSIMLNPIAEATDADVRCEIETNLLAPILCIREVIPYMRKRSSGDIVNISSESVQMPFPFLSIYAATKGGLEVLSVGLRRELQDEGIRVTVFRSGFMAESASAGQWKPALKARFYEILQRTGFGHIAGAGTSPSLQAQAVLAVLCVPREATVDHIVVRSAR